MSAPNEEQAAYWNEQAGQKWVANQEAMDAQLAPLGLAAMDRLALQKGERVLDVGSGAGDTTLAIAARTGGPTLGVDISEPLLGRARQRAGASATTRFELADAQTFRFVEGSFDAVFSRFGVMFFADPVAAFRNLHRALRPGGRLAFVCWRAMRENPWVTVPLDATLRFLPEAPEPPPPGAPGPFAFAEAEHVLSILTAAGFAQIEIAAHDHAIASGGGDPDHAAELALQIGPSARALAGVTDPAVRAAVRTSLRDAFARHVGPNGLTLDSATWIVTAAR